MKSKFIISLLLITCIVCSCSFFNSSTRYKKADHWAEANEDKCGYEDKRLSNNHYTISFTGNQYTSDMQVLDFVILRAAELAIKNKYKYFVIVPDTLAMDSNMVKEALSLRKTISTTKQMLSLFGDVNSEVELQVKFYNTIDEVLFDYKHAYEAEIPTDYLHFLYDYSMSDYIYDPNKVQIQDANIIYNFIKNKYDM